MCRVLAICLCVAACAPVEAVTPAALSALEQPARCERVRPDESLGARLATAGEGATLCLDPGLHRGPVVVTRRVTIWGPREAIVAARTPSTVIEIKAAGAALLGLTVDGRGGHYDREDAAVAIRADDVTVRGVRVQNAVFGILADRARRLTIADNEISGQRDVALGLRGDGIRLWETYDSRVLNNRLRDGRDLVVWYSPHNLFENNESVGGRYGTHFMHASDNVVRRGRFVGNAVGIFVMYSHRITVEDSMFLDCSSAGGMGLGIKDSGDVTVRRSSFVRNASAVYVDNSPGVVGERDRLEHNLFQLNVTAIVFHGMTAHNEVFANRFASNRDAVAVEGGGDALAAHFRENQFDDYVGYDLDGDGFGDVPHEVRSLSSELASTHRGIAFFRGTPAFGVVEALGRLVPLFTPKPLFVDTRPSYLSASEVSHGH